MQDDLNNAMSHFIDKVVRIADKHDADRDATLRTAIRILRMFEAVVSLENYEVSEEVEK